MAWSADGLRMALTLPSGPGGQRTSRTSCPKRNTDNLLILESSSGAVLVSVNTGDLPGPVCFGPHGEVFTAPFHFYARASKGEQVKVWDGRTGALERTFGLPGRDVYDVLTLSRDGKILAGYVGKVKVDYWHAIVKEDPLVTVDERFAVWDVATGDVLAVSQDMGPLSGTWRGQASRLRLRLSADGRSLLANWDATPSNVLLFDLPDMSAAPPR